MASNVIILNVFAQDIAHEIGFAATFRALLKSFLAREDLADTQPLILVVLRDLDGADRHKRLMPEITESFKKRVRDLKKEILKDAKGKEDGIAQVARLVSWLSFTERGSNRPWSTDMIRNASTSP